MGLETHRVKGEVRGSGHLATQLFDTKQIPKDTRVTDKALSYFRLSELKLRNIYKAPIAVHNIICYHKNIHGGGGQRRQINS